MASAVPIEALATLRRRLAALPARHSDRRLLMDSTAQLYAISRATLYRLLREDRRPKDAYRSDRGCTRAMPAGEIKRLCEIVAAMKIRTTNRKGRHLSTVRVLELLQEHGVDTPERVREARKGPHHCIHPQSASEPPWLRSRANDPRAAGGSLPGGAFERDLALRYEPVGPEAAEGTAVD